MRDTVTADVYARLLEQLSADGRARLRAHVQEQKRNIRLFRPAPGGADPVVR